jgi:hypothetical protein
MTQQAIYGVLTSVLVFLCGVLGYFIKRAFDDLKNLKDENFKLQIQNLKDLQVTPLEVALRALEAAKLEERIARMKDYDLRLLAEQLSKLTDANLEQQILELQKYQLKEIVEDVEALKNARLEDKVKNLQEDGARDRKELTEKISRSTELLSALNETVANLESLAPKHHHPEDDRKLEDLGTELKAALDELNRRSTEADIELKKDVQKLDHELYLLRRVQGKPGPTEISQVS